MTTPTLEMSLRIKQIEALETVDGITYSVMILGDTAMSGGGEGTPDDVAVTRFTLRNIKYRENIDLARLIPDTIVRVTITPEQTQIGDYGDKSGE